ncbi:unnamed protein product [Lathyrus oleraceus]
MESWFIIRLFLPDIIKGQDQFSVLRTQNQRKNMHQRKLRSSCNVYYDSHFLFREDRNFLALEKIMP